MHEDLGFARTVSAGQFFMTRSTVQLKVFGDTSSCRENTHPRDDAECSPKGAIGNDTKIGPALDVVTQRYSLFGVQIKIDSMMNDETKSWVVIRR